MRWRTANNRRKRPRSIFWRIHEGGGWGTYLSWMAEDVVRISYGPEGWRATVVRDGEEIETLPMIERPSTVRFEGDTSYNMPSGFVHL